MPDRPDAGFPHDSTLPLLAAFVLALAFLGVIVAIMQDDSSAGARPAATTTTRTTPRPEPAATADAPVVHVTLTVSTAGDGSGRIRIGSDVRDCSDEPCQVRVEQGEDISLAARPADDSTFVGWTGSCSSPRVCRVRMDRSQSLIALFASDKAAAPAASSPDAECNDDFDNDGDGSIDDLDPECAISDSEFPAEDPLEDLPPPPPPPPVLTPPPVVPPPPPPPPPVVTP